MLPQVAMHSQLPRFLVELFSLGAVSGAMSEYRLAVAVFEEGGSLWPKISGRRRRPPPTICAPLDGSYNSAAESFHTKKLCSRLSSRKVLYFIRKTTTFRF